MMKRAFFLLVCVLCIITTTVGCSKKPEKDVMEEIRNSVAVKLEWAERSREPYINSSGPMLFTSVADWDISPTDGVTSEDWIYRFTYNPSEVCINMEEIVVEFGLTQMSINGIVYKTDDASTYETAFEWAKAKYEYYVLSE